MSAPRRLREILDAGTDTLPCGHRVDEVFEQAADGHAHDLDTHQQGCPHCHAGLREFETLWQPVRELAAEPVTLPAAVTKAVSVAIRKLAADIWYTLQLTDGGSIRIAARVVAALARDAARRVPRVRAALGRSTESRVSRLVEKATLGHRHPHAAVGVLGRTAVIDIAVAVTYGDQVDAVGREIQRRVIAELRDKVGLQDVAVNVTIDDVLDPRPPTQ